MDYQQLVGLRQHHPAWRLLCSPHAPLIVSFLERTFVGPNTRSLDQHSLASRLEDHLYTLRESLGEDAFPRAASAYLDEWADNDNDWQRLEPTARAPCPEHEGGQKLAKTENKADQMKIDLDQMSAEELVALNHRIVERLKFLESLKNHQDMMAFSIGQKVSFEPAGRQRQIGTLVKYNQKTVTVITEAGQKWNVSPHLLSPVKEVKSSQGQHNIMDFQPRKPK